MFSAEHPHLPSLAQMLANRYRGRPYGLDRVFELSSGHAQGLGPLLDLFLAPQRWGAREHALHASSQVSILNCGAWAKRASGFNDSCEAVTNA